MKVLDSFLDLVSTMTGVKNEFIGQGWSELAAEQMVVSLLQVTAAGANAGSEANNG